jgi:eukaryotic-like serine/threonine-protein kinase
VSRRRDPATTRETVATTFAGAAPAAPTPVSVDTALAPTADSGAAATGDDEAGAEAEALPPGTEVGRYRVERRLGAGAMGVVYVALDPELDRRVALKLLQPRLHASDGAHARLRREARAMARLAHRQLVTVHDVGRFRDGLFLAMELLDGSTLRTWCQAPGRSWREILGAYRDAGLGLAAAHAAGIVHRDFKPENVLVGDDGRVAVTDFGVALAAADADADAAAAAADDADADAAATLAVGGASDLADPDLRLTRTGALIGTPAYMAPEQLDGGRADARSDQFAYCVALWEALLGARPFVAEDGGLPALRAAIGAGALPLPPAGARVPARVLRALRRGLRAAPAERWPAMADLLRALDVRRPRRGPIAAAAALVVLGGAGLTIGLLASRPSSACQGAEAQLAAVWNAPRRDLVRTAFVATGMPFADTTWRQVDADVGDWAERWARQRTATCEATRRHREQSEGLLDLRMRCLDRGLGQLDALLEVLARATPAAVERARSAVAELPAPAECADTERLLAAPPPPAGPADRVRAAALEARLREGEALSALGDFPGARARVDAVVPEARALGHPPVLAWALDSAGAVRFQLGEHGEALPWLEEAVNQAELARDDRLRAQATLRIANTLHMLERYGEARTRVAAGLAILERAGDHPRLAVQLALLDAEIAVYEQRHDDALAALAALMPQIRGLGRDGKNPAVRAFAAWATVFQARSWFHQAIALAHAAHAIAEDYYGPDHPRTASTLLNLGAAYLYRGHPGDSERALPYLERSLRIREQRLGADHPSLAYPVQNLAVVQRRLGRLDEAQAGYRRALALFEAAQGPEASAVASPLAGLAQIHLARGEPALAHPLLERVLALFAQHGKDALAVAEQQFLLGRALWESGADRARARRLVEEAHAVFVGRKAHAAARRAVAERWLGDPDGYRPAPGDPL